MFSRLTLYFLVFIAFFTRFVGLDWGNGYYFHPDENNMATALSQLSAKDLNPHFYAYGQFPLYLGYLSLQSVGAPNTFANSILILRFWSAIFSLASVYIFYLISKNIFDKNSAIGATLLFIFSPGLIQISHFGTTESLLVFVCLASIYLSLLLISSPHRLKLIILGSITVGIGLASKISAVFFLAPIVLSLVINTFRSKNIWQFFREITIFLSLAIVIGLLLSPYNLLDKNSFFDSMSYETSVATGKLPVFYTHQFVNTTPYVFQLQKIFPYTSGLPQFFLAFVGILFLGRLKNKLQISHVLISSLIYFIYFGSLYVKWTRFMSPLFFMFPLLSTIAISRFKHKILRSLLFFVCLCPGLLFASIYYKPDVRIVATNWVKKNINISSHLLSESGNVVNLPVSGNYMVDNFDFYNNYQAPALAQSLALADYIFVPSRRVFLNYQYPYYQSLFNGKLGFIKLIDFTPNYSWPLISEQAEETWSVFDHPTIRIFKRTNKLSIPEYEALIKI